MKNKKGIKKKAVTEENRMKWEFFDMNINMCTVVMGTVHNSRVPTRPSRNRTAGTPSSSCPICEMNVYDGYYAILIFICEK